MPLLAVLVGVVVAVAWEDNSDEFLSTRNFVIASSRFICLLMLATILVMTTAAFLWIHLIDPKEHASVSRSELIAAAAVSAIVCFYAVKQSDIIRRGWALAALVVLLGIPFAQWKNAERMRYSGRAVGIELRGYLGNDPRVSTAAVVRDLPQVFFYAGVNVDAFGEKGLDKLAAAPGRRWIVLNDIEFAKLIKSAPGRLDHITPLHLAKDTLYLAQYSGPSPTS